MGTIPGDDGARHQVAQALGSGMKRDQQQADEIGRGQGIGDPKQVPHRGGAEAHRMAGVHDHADARDPLAGRLAAPQALEQDEVAVPDDEAGQHQDHRSQPSDRDAVAGQDREHDEQGQPRSEENQHVEHGRQRATADAGDLEIEHDVLGGLDFQMLAIVGRRRRQGGHAAIVISFRP